MKKTKKALASLAIAGMVLSMAPMSVFAADATTRLSGADRVATAIAVAANGWTAGSDSVIVVSADDANIVDALAAAPLAGQLNAPILVTYKDALDAQVQQKIVDLKAKNVYAIGALSDATVASLKAISGVTVEQLQGADRTETAAKVTAKLSKVNGSFVVAYDGKADALSAASFAAANSYSIVIANPDGTIPTNETVVAPTYTVGGQVTVAGATALAGVDRYATNAAVVNGLTYSYDKVYVANGESLVDALAGAPLAAKTKSPIVLADAAQAVTAANDNLTSSSQVIALGGVGAVSDAVLGKVAYQAPATLAVESVSAINAMHVQVKFNQAVDVLTASTVANYKLVAVGGSDIVSSVELDDANTTVDITLSSALANTDTNYTLTVDGVKTASKALEISDFSKVYTLADTVRPTVGGLEWNDSQTIKFAIDKDVDVNNTSGNLKNVNAFVAVYDSKGLKKFGFNNAGTEATYDSTNDVVKVDVSSLAEGTYTLKVVGLMDKAGNLVSPNPTEKTFTVADDSTKPEVSSIEQVGVDGSDKGTIKVVFSEKIQSNGTNGFAVDLDNVNDAGVVISNPSNDRKTFYATLSANSNIAQLHKVAVKNYSDLAGNTNDAKVVYVTFKATNPTVSNVEYKTTATGNKVIVKFSTDIVSNTPADITSGSYVDDNVQFALSTLASGGQIDKEQTSVSDINDDDMNEFVINADDYDNATLGNQALPGGIYSVTIPAGVIKDFAGQTNASKTISFTIPDSSTTQGSVDQTNTNTLTATAQGSDANKVVVKFDREVDSTTALNINNYAIEGVNVFTGSAYFTDSTKTAVKLTMASNSIAFDNQYTVTVKNVVDSDGVAIKNFSGLVTLKENQAPFIAKASITANNTISVTFNESLAVSPVVDKDDFVVTVNGAVASISTAVTSGAVTTITLSNALTDATSVVVVKTSDSFDGKDAYGNKGTIGSQVTASWSTSVDTTAPTTATLSAKTIAASSSITVTMNEAINASSKTAVENAIKAQVAVGVGQALVGELTFTWNPAGTVLTIANTNVTDTASFAADTTVSVTDLAGNTNASVALDLF